jgi:hypothetical protein
MSLLNTASTFTTIESTKNNKRVAHMKKTFDQINKEYKVPSSETFEANENQARNERINEIIHKSQPSGDDDGDSLHPFRHGSSVPNHPGVVPPMPSLQKGPQYPTTTNESQGTQRNTESFMNPSAMHKARGSPYSTSYVPTPYYKGLGAKMPTGAPAPVMAPGGSAQLMEKLNYMIHLLEEQQKEPTQNIMEEFLLYGLLGVFMIYVVDSFARAGKYIR